MCKSRRFSTLYNSRTASFFSYLLVFFMLDLTLCFLFLALTEGFEQLLLNLLVLDLTNLPKLDTLFIASCSF